MHKSNPENRRKLLAMFKAPAWLTMPAAAFDISDRTIKYMESQWMHNIGLLPTRYEEKEIQPGIIKDGDIQDLSALSEELGYFRKKYKKFKFVNIALPEEIAYVFDIIIKKSEVENSNIRQVLEFKLPEYIPFSPQQALFDYDIILNTDNYMHLAVTVYPHEIVEEYLQAFEEAGFTVKSAELETLSIARATIDKDAFKSNETFMVVDVGNSKLGVSIISSSTTLFSTTIAFNFKEYFTHLFKVTHDRDPKDDNELFDWKFKEGILFVPDKELEELKDILFTKLLKIKDYFNSHKNGQLKDISHIYIAGGNAATKGIDAIFSETLKTPASLANVWRNMFDIEKQVPEIDRQHSYMYGTLAGLSLKENSYE